MSKRITEIELAGKMYPMNFSMRAVKKFIERYGKVEDMWRELGKMSRIEQVDEYAWILSLLIEQGCAYKRLADEEDIKPPSKEDLEILLGFTDIANLSDIIQKAIVAGVEPEVEVELKKKAAELEKDALTRLGLHGANTTEQSSILSAENMT